MKKLITLAITICMTGVFITAVAQKEEEKKARKQEKVWDLRIDIDKALDKGLRELDLALNEIEINTRNLNINLKGVGKDVEVTLRDLGKELEGLCVEKQLECDSSDNYSNTDKETWYDIEKSKKINKSFQLSANQKLDIENRFGRIHVNTWDKSEATVEVNIIVRAGSESRAQELLSKITVDFTEDGSAVLCRTQIPTMNTNWNGNKAFEINYTVNMPRNNPLRTYNKFGDVYVADINGKTDLQVGYGNLKTERLNNTENNIQVSFGGAYIPYAKQCRINVSYADSGFKLGTTESADLTCSYSDVEIENVGTMVVRSKYSQLEIGTAGSIQGSAGYSDFTVRKLASSLSMDSKYCGDFEVKAIAKNFKSISVDNSFSTIELGFSPESSFNFDVGVGFCDLKMDKSNIQYSHIEKQNNSASYKGKYGKSGTNSMVSIKSKYGDVRVSMRE
jgi:hypothetical protein